MSLNGAVLAWTSIKALMGTDTGIMIKHLDDIACCPHIDLLLDIFVRDRVLHIVYGYMIIELNGGLLPGRPFIGGSRQRRQKRLFFLKENTVPAAFFLLERAAVIGIQL